MQGQSAAHSAQPVVDRQTRDHLFILLAQKCERKIMQRKYIQFVQTSVQIIILNPWTYSLSPFAFILFESKREELDSWLELKRTQVPLSKRELGRLIGIVGSFAVLRISPRFARPHAETRVHKRARVHERDGGIPMGSTYSRNEFIHPAEWLSRAVGNFFSLSFPLN